MDFPNIKIDANDASGRKIKQVYFREKTYVIYEAVDGTLVADGPDAKLSDDIEVNEAFAAVSELTTRLPRFMPRYNMLRAQALEAIYSKKNDVAKGLIKRLRGHVAAMLERWAKLAYLLGALCGFASVLVVYWICYGLDIFMTGHPRFLFLMIVFGAMGGFLSVGLGVGFVNLDIRLPFSVNIAYGSVRIVIACVCAVSAHYLMNAGLILTTLGSESEAGAIVVYFLGGFSQTLIPNILKELPADSDNN